VKKAGSDTLKALLSLLRKLDKEELLEIIEEAVERDASLGALLLKEYGTAESQIDSAMRRLSIAIMEAEEHYGYADTFDVIHEAEEVLRLMQSAKEYDAMDRAVLCIDLLEELVPFCDSSGDHDGDVGFTVNEVIERLRITLAQAKEDHADLFGIVFEHATSSIYRHYVEWRMPILEACIPLCGGPSNRSKLESYLSETKEGDSSGYIEEKQNALAVLIARFDGEGEAALYESRHPENNSFRTKAIENALNEKNFERAVELCKEGEARGDNVPYRFLREWKESRYKAYEGMGDTNAQ